jgi:hypothetical protein
MINRKYFLFILPPVNLSEIFKDFIFLLSNECNCYAILKERTADGAPMGFEEVI